MANPLSSSPPGTVKLGGEMGDRVSRTIDNNLMRLDIENDFLAPFARPTATGGFIGLGKLVDAAAWMTANTLHPELVDCTSALVSRVLALQDDDGYLGMFAPDCRLWELWDIHEMAFIIQGLVHDHLLNNGPGLDAAIRIARYVMRGLRSEPDRTPIIGDLGSISHELSFLGLEEALVLLFEVTGDEEYLSFLEQRLNIYDWALPIVKGRFGTLEGHAYAYLCKCVAQLRLYRITGDERLLSQTRRAVDFLYLEGGAAITGGIGQHECWHDSQDGGSGLGESCAQAYLLWVLDELIRLGGTESAGGTVRIDTARLGDLMERVIYNTLFGSQSPSGREIRYYTPFEGRRFYWGSDTYCCPNNHRRAMSRLPNHMYYLSSEGVYINLYSDSSCDFTHRDGGKVTIVQRTNYPSDGKILISLSVSRPAGFEIDLRIPGWAKETSLEAMGQRFTPEAGSIQTISRTWRDGDTIQLEMPVRTRFIAGRSAQAGRVAIMRGPRVFTLSRNRNRAHEANLSDADFRRLIIDPESVSEPYCDDSTRRGGVGLSVHGWTPGHVHVEKANTTMYLSEFPDPDGETSYFLVPNPEAGIIEQDELYRL